MDFDPSVIGPRDIIKLIEVCTHTADNTETLLTSLCVLLQVNGLGRRSGKWPKILSTNPLPHEVVSISV